MTLPRDTYSVEIAGLKRELPLFEVAPGLRIAVLNILGDTELVQACAKVLAEKLSEIEYEFLVTAEAKSILSSETLSITTGQPQMLYLDEKDHDLVKGMRIVLLDDVISTGSTLQGMRLLMEKAGAQVVAEAGIFTEGERARWRHIIALGHLPLFTEQGLAD
jgi:adenine/guanine phosphoribosyltransferase-like PRPP-binding protein